MPHVASTSNVSNIQHNAGLNQRDRTADAPSPFAMLLDETTAPPPPQRNQSAPTQSNSSAPTSETRRADRAEPDRPEQARTTDAAEPASDQPETDAAEQPPRAEASEATAEGGEEAPAETATTIDAVLAASVETPAAPAQPVAAVIAPPTDVSAPLAAEAQVETSPGAIPAAATPTAPVPPGTPELIDAAPTAPTPAADAAATSDAPAAEAPAATVPAAQPATASDPLATATTPSATDATAATADNAVAPPEPDQTQPPPQPAAVPSRPVRNAAAVAPTESKPADDAATSSQAPAPTTVATSELEDGQRVAGTETTAQPDEQAEAPTTSESQAKESAERPQQARAVSDVVQAAAKPTPDNLHLAHPQAGQDFGQSVAAAAQAQRPDATNPVGPQATAAVPIESIAVTIAARAQAGSSRFEIRLDPPELGRIDVRLDIDRSGQVTSRLVVERAETLEVLRRDAYQLERALQDAGLKTSDNALQFSLRDQSFADRNNRDSDGLQATIADPELPAPDIAVPAAYGLTRLGGSGVDIRV